MIGWHITPGYNSGYTGDVDWQVVKVMALAICSDYVRIFDNTKGYAPVDLLTKVAEVAETYKPGSMGCPITIDDEQIMIVAGGGGDYRAAKEHTARAFVRLLMAACHSAGFDISVSVA